MLIGEDGLLDFESDFIADSLDIAFGSPPVRRVTVEGTIKWDQIAAGYGRHHQALARCLPRPPAAVRQPSDMRTLTGDGLMLDWPQAEKNIGGGWVGGHARCAPTASSCRRTIRPGDHDQRHRPVSDLDHQADADRRL
jgi:hypothetical protein